MRTAVNQLFFDEGATITGCASSWACLLAIAMLGVVLTIIIRKHVETL